MPSSRLIPITYYNAAKEIRISAYADIIVIEPARPEPILRCIRFGGYPEMVQAIMTRSTPALRLRRGSGM